MPDNGNYQTFIKPVSRAKSGHEQGAEPPGQIIQLNPRHQSPASGTFKSVEPGCGSIGMFSRSDKLST